MWSDIQYVKGIHPGKIIERELKIKGISQKALASYCGMHPQTLNAIIQGHRGLPVGSAVRLDGILGHDHGYYAVLQAYYDAREAKKALDLSLSIIPNINKMIFWDTQFDKIDWIGSREFVLKRVKDMGTEEDQETIEQFYADYDQRISSL